MRIVLAFKPLKWFTISASIHSPRFKPRAMETRYYCGMVLTIFSLDWVFLIGMDLNPFLLIVCIVLALARHVNRLAKAKRLFNLRTGSSAALATLLVTLVGVTVTLVGAKCFHPPQRIEMLSPERSSEPFHLKSNLYFYAH
jgi:hypothetical protein